MGVQVKEWECAWKDRKKIAETEEKGHFYQTEEWRTGDCDTELHKFLE